MLGVQPGQIRTREGSPTSHRSSLARQGRSIFIFIFYPHLTLHLGQKRVFGILGPIKGRKGPCLPLHLLTGSGQIWDKFFFWGGFYFWDPGLGGMLGLRNFLQDFPSLSP